MRLEHGGLRLFGGVGAELEFLGTAFSHIPVPFIDLVAGEAREFCEFMNIIAGPVLPRVERLFQDFRLPRVFLLALALVAQRARRDHDRALRFEQQLGGGGRGRRKVVGAGQGLSRRVHGGCRLVLVLFDQLTPGDSLRGNRKVH